MSQKQRKVFIVAGHGGTDIGAVGNGYVESQLTIEFRNLIIAELGKLGIKAETDSDKNALAASLKWLKGLVSPNSIAIDIHWNASSNDVAKGSEVIIPELSSSFERAIARKLLDVFVDAGFRDRGVKSELLTERKRLGWMRPSCENILIEVCFITNKQDMVVYQANKKLLAKRLALVIRDFRNK